MRSSSAIDQLRQLDVLVLDRLQGPAQGGADQVEPAERARLERSSSSWYSARDFGIVTSAEPPADVVLGRFLGRVGEDRRRSAPISTRRPGLPVSSRLKKAVMSLARAACCMLWVTITIV